MNRFVSSALGSGISVVFGVFVGFAVAVVLTIISAGVFHFSPLSEAYLSIVALAVLTVGVFVGGIFGARSAGSRGLFHGLAVGCVFFLLVLGITALIPSHHFAIGTFIERLLACIIAGICGGILGVSSS